LHKVLDTYSTWSGQVKGKGKGKAKATTEDTEATETPEAEALPTPSRATTSGLGVKGESPLKARSTAAPITEEFSEFILADLKEVIEQSEKSDSELSAFEVLRKEKEITEYQTPDSAEEDEDEEKNATTGDRDIILSPVNGDLGATTTGSSEDKSGLLIKNVFEIPAYDADVTVEMQQEIEQKVKNAALTAVDSGDTILEVIVEEREVTPPLPLPQSQPISPMAKKY